MKLPGSVKIERDFESAIIQWQRLVWVPGIGIECEFQAEAEPEEKGVVPEWRPEQYGQKTF
ncbi:MAG: hypothetical protein H6936_00690 [Burkholderiales bacterium]|nr:hypothetical protein [Nitrosomonas sp.]MCP5273372.1 hypothetical protein [Burkholderiales bacterium]